MRLSFAETIMFVGMLVGVGLTPSFSQDSFSQDSTSANNDQPAFKDATASQTGPRGGTLKPVRSLHLETLVTTGGVKLFAYDDSLEPIIIDQAQGVVLIHVEGNSKRYRYDLLADGKGGLVARVNLSKLAGRQIGLEIKVTGIPDLEGSPVSLTELTMVPASEAQLAAAAIKLQKTCPVSKKTLGSMGDPLAVELDGTTLYVCCAGCVDAVKSDPEKFLIERPKVVVSKVTKADKALIARQANCPVMDEPLGSMGGPIKLLVGDKPVFLCCKGCIKKVQADPVKYASMIYGEEGSQTVPAGTEQVREGVFKVGAADNSFIKAQKKCPVMDEPLDAMGGPYKVHAAGKAIYICCPGCAKRISADPEKYLAVLETQGVKAPVIR